MDTLDVIGNAVIFLAVAVFMEGVAWATHKYVMHGFLWVLHKDHHRPKGRGLQRNDAFALFFATVSILLILNGLNHGWGPMAAAGFGMALYGVGYTVFHDIMFHRRIPGLRYRPKSGYMKRIVRAHRAHHRHPHKSPSESFSFLYAPRKYARSEAL